MVIHRLWSVKIDESKLFFMWKILMGAIPSCEKVTVRGLGSAICTGCKVVIETVRHLFAIVLA